MAVGKDLVKELALAVKETSDPVESEFEGGKLLSYSAEEIVASFTDKKGRKTFFALAFEALGREFVLMPDGTLVLQSYDPNTGEAVTYAVTDSELEAALEKFLQWRLDTLESLGI